MNTAIFLPIFLTLAVCYLIIGLLASRNIKTNEDYFLAGRGLGLMSLSFTLIATHLGGGMILGTAQEAYEVGWYGILYNFGLCAGFIVLGLGFASKLRAFNVATTAQLFETKYGSPVLRKIASALSAMSLCGILAGLVIATRSSFVALGITSQLPLILFWIFTIIYTMIGGLKAVVITDIFQVIFIITVFSGVFFYNLLFGQAVLATTAVNLVQPFSLELASFSRLFGFFFMPFLLSFVVYRISHRS